MIGEKWKLGDLGDDGYGKVEIGQPRLGKGGVRHGRKEVVYQQKKEGDMEVHPERHILRRG